VPRLRRGTSGAARFRTRAIWNSRARGRD
jgi:hypothetical protein